MVQIFIKNAIKDYLYVNSLILNFPTIIKKSGAQTDKHFVIKMKVITSYIIMGIYSTSRMHPSVSVHASI